jgi:tRNA (mo5U34)-methyltransferase
MATRTEVSESISSVSIPQERRSVKQRIEALGDWFQNINLAGEWTAPNHFLGDYPNIKWQCLKEFLPNDLRGCTVLEIGCNAGFYALQMKHLGADAVVAIDSDPRYLAQARLAAEVQQVEIDFRQMSVYDVGSLKRRFDIVLFMGVLYHLRHPLLALDIIAEHAVRDTLIFQSLLRGNSSQVNLEADYSFSEEQIFDEPGYPVLHFVEQSYAHDPTNWWIPNRACAEAMLRSAGFTVVARPDGDIFICRRNSALAREVVNG